MGKTKKFKPKEKKVNKKFKQSEIIKKQIDKEIKNVKKSI